MTNSIYRESVYVTDYQELELTGPPLSVAPARDGVTSDMFDLWFEHMDEGEEHRKYPIWVFGTGHPVPWRSPGHRKLWRFLGTVVTPSGLIWHVFTGPAKDL